MEVCAPMLAYPEREMASSYVCMYVKLIMILSMMNGQEKAQNLYQFLKAIGHHFLILGKQKWYQNKGENVNSADKCNGAVKCNFTYLK
jgi:predicted homoserine dehydrogenase-like protein